MSFGYTILGFGSGGARYITTANDYDGSNDFALRGADLTGAADGKAGTVSFWVRLDGGDGSNLVIIENNSVRFRALRTSNDFFLIRGRNTSDSTILQIVSNTAFTASSSWIHVLCSWNLATPEAHLFINDANDEAAGATETDDTIDYTDTDWGIGAKVDGTLKFNGCISEFWFEDTFIDITVEANRRKFINSGLKPVDLGSDGSRPTGASPLIYATNGDPSTNNGTGGNFVITGALTACSTSPSD